MTDHDWATPYSAPCPVRVLIVDDQETFRSAARLVVELTDGFEVAGEAADGEQAIAMVDDLQPDLVLMDIKMPGIDGIEATRLVMATSPAPKVIVLSTYDEFEARALAAGAVAYVPKSAFGPDEIIAAWNESR